MSAFLPVKWKRSHISCAFIYSKFRLQCIYFSVYWYIHCTELINFSWLNSCISTNYASPSNEGRHIVLVWFFLPLLLLPLLLFPLLLLLLSEACPDHCFFIFPDRSIINGMSVHDHKAVCHILKWPLWDLDLWPQGQIIVFWIVFSCPGHNIFVFRDRSIIFGMWVHDHKAVCRVP